MKKHEYFMQKAIEEAAKAEAMGEVPVGAVLVVRDRIIAKEHNEKETRQDPTAHAEIIVIKQASKKFGSWRLNDADIYVTVEPCPMCLGAMLQARIRRLFFGAPDPKAGAAGSVVDLTAYSDFNHQIEVVGGILEEDCRRLIQDFFKRKR